MSVSLIVQESPVRTVVRSAIVTNVQGTTPVWFGSGGTAIEAPSDAIGVPSIVAVPEGLTPLNSTATVNPAAFVKVTAAPERVAPGMIPLRPVATSVGVSLG